MGKSFVDVILLNKLNEILLLKRKDDDSLFPSKWCLPGGHVDEGERLRDAAIRECEEETGIKCTDLSKVCAYHYKDGGNTVVFIGIEDQDFSDPSVQLMIREHSKYEWVHVSKVLDFDLCGELPSVIRKAFQDE